MDQEGFLPIGLIASFHRVQALTTDVNLIVEVRGFPQILGWDAGFISAGQRLPGSPCSQSLC